MHRYIIISGHVKLTFFYSRDVVNGVLATATCLAGWLAVRHVPVLYQNGLTYLKTFSTIWKPHHSSFSRPLRRYTIPRGTRSAGR